MSNEIQPVPQALSLELYDKMSDPMEAIKTLGAAIFKSGMFGCTKTEQGEVLAMQCLAERKPPLEIAKTYHFINGKLSIKSDALLGKFLIAGGSVQWGERTATKVVGTFSKGGSSVVITATMDEFIANGVATGNNKETWRKYPRQMLTARAISEGVRLVGPDCCFGLYTAEEMDQKVTRKPSSIIDIVPPGKTETAVKLLVSAGMLEEGQQLSDLSALDEESILKKPQAFIEAINK